MKYEQEILYRTENIARIAWNKIQKLRRRKESEPMGIDKN